MATGKEENRLAALLAAIEGGSENALEQLYRAVHAQVYAFALKQVRDPIEAADVLNEVMLEVWRNAARFEGRSKALTWILGITHHKSIDVLRRRRGETIAEPDPEIPDSDFDLHQALTCTENAEWLRRCLARLSDAHRAVIHLAFFDDLGYHEIAAIVDCPVGTVKTRMFHAKRLLKECLSALVGDDAQAVLT